MSFELWKQNKVRYRTFMDEAFSSYHEFLLTVNSYAFSVQFSLSKLIAISE